MVYFWPIKVDKIIYDLRLKWTKYYDRFSNVYSYLGWTCSDRKSNGTQKHPMSVLHSVNLRTSPQHNPFEDFVHRYLACNLNKFVRSFSKLLPLPLRGYRYKNI